MKSSYRSLRFLLAFSLLTPVFSGYAWDFDWKGFKSGFNKSYYAWWLIHPIYQVADSEAPKWCKEELPVTKLSHIMVLKKYETPRWVTWLSAIPFKESMFDYAYDIYKTVQLEMDGLMKMIDDKIDKDQLTETSRIALKKQQSAWGDLYYAGFDHVLNEGAAKFEPSEEQILNNIKEAFKILDALIAVFPTLTVAQSTITQQLADQANSIQSKLRNSLIGKDSCSGEDRLKKPRISAIERLHRKKQAQWLADYVMNVCVMNVCNSKICTVK